MVEYRNYQQKCNENNLKLLLSDGYTSVMDELATGLGKGLMLTKDIENLLVYMQGKILVLVHKRELIKQLYEDITSVITHAKVVVEQADRIELQTTSNFDIAICSIQTLQSRPEVLSGIDWKAIVIDETHRAMADGYQQILNVCGFDLNSPQTSPKLLGYTATGYRADKQSLDSIYQTVGFKRDALWGMDQGWLVPIRAKRVSMMELSGTKLQNSIVSNNKLQHVYNSFIDMSCDSTGKVIHPSMFMVGSVDEGRELAKLFNSNGYDFPMVDYNMSDSNRTAATEGFKNGALNGILGYNIFIEGYNAPRASRLYWLRNTGSPVTFVQGLGRITRPVINDKDIFSQFNTSTDKEVRRFIIKNSSKPESYFIDFSDETSKFNGVTIGKIFGLNKAFDFEENVLHEVISDMTEIAEQYQVIQTDLIENVSEIGKITEDVDIWRRAVTVNHDVPDNAGLVYIKIKDEWRFVFSDADIRWTLAIKQDSRGAWQSYIGQPETWKEWYWNNRAKTWAQKWYRGKAKPDTTKVSNIKGKPVPRYTKICGLPMQLLHTASTKEQIFYEVENYIYTNFHEDVWTMNHKNAPWRSKPVSDKQRAQLDKMRKKGIALPESIDRGTAFVLADLFYRGDLSVAKLKKTKKK